MNLHRRSGSLLGRIGLLGLILSLLFSPNPGLADPGRADIARSPYLDSLQGNETIELSAIEITQGIQDLKNSVPLIQDRRTFVRAHVRSLTGAPINGATAKLIGTRNGAALGELQPINRNGAINVLPNPKRIEIADTFTFQLPTTWLNGIVTLEVQGVSHTLRCVDTLQTANDCKAVADFSRVVPQMEVAFLYGTDQRNGRTYTADNQTRVCTVRALETFLPISGVNSTVLPDRLNANGVRNNSTVVNDVSAIWRRNGRPNQHYYGLFLKDAAAGGGSGLATVGGFLGVGDYGDFMPQLNVHEFGHNLGYSHAPCGVAAPNSQFPYPEARISNAQTGPDAFFGFDIYTGKIHAPDSKDLMSYCGPAWIADWTYTGMIPTLQGKYTRAGRSADSPVVSNTIAVTTSEVIRVSGVVSATGTSESPDYELFIDELVGQTANDAIESPASGPFAVVLLDDQGSEIERLPFAIEDVEGIEARGGIEGYSFEPADEPDGLFSVLVPGSLDPDSATRAVRIEYDGTVKDEISAGSASPPTLEQLTIQSSGSTTLTLSMLIEGSSDLDVYLDYSPEADGLWNEIDYGFLENVSGQEVLDIFLDTRDLPGSDNYGFRVRLSDGFFTVQEEVYSLSGQEIADKAPEPVVQSGIEDNVLGSGIIAAEQTIVLEGYATDLEDGRIPDSDLLWYSNLDGLLGSGETLLIRASELSQGNHQIWLEATDSAGNVGSSGDSSATPSGARGAGAAPICGARLNQNVTLDVFREPPERPSELSVSPTPLEVEIILREDNPPAVVRTLAIRNLGSGTVNWTATSSNPALVTVQNGNGTAPGDVTLNINGSAATIGETNGTITVASNAAQKSTIVVPFRVRVIDQRQAATPTPTTAPPTATPTTAPPTATPTSVTPPTATATPTTAPPTATPLPPQLTVVKDSIPATIGVNDTDFDYRITVRNVGGSPATGVSVRDVLPNGIGYVGPTQVDIDGVTSSGGVAPQLVQNRTLQPGQTMTVSFKVVINSKTGGEVTNTATVSADGLADQSASVVLTLPARSRALSIAAVAAPAGPKRLGDRVTIYIAVSNTSKEELRNVQILVDENPGLTYVGPTLIQLSGAVRTGGAPPELASGIVIPVGEALFITFPMRVSASGGTVVSSIVANAEGVTGSAAGSLIFELLPALGEHPLFFPRVRP